MTKILGKLIRPLRYTNNRKTEYAPVQCACRTQVIPAPSGHNLFCSEKCSPIPEPLTLTKKDPAGSESVADSFPPSHRICACIGAPLLIQRPVLKHWHLAITISNMQHFCTAHRPLNTTHATAMSFGSDSQVTQDKTPFLCIPSKVLSTSVPWSIPLVLPIALFPFTWPIMPTERRQARRTGLSP